ncbi:hypothetical protein J6590_017622 [Homalodisca vitripennis]|nr:hypothetical protein J6590_017622 [Homalodisca vitripennis]
MRGNIRPEPVHDSVLPISTNSPLPSPSATDISTSTIPPLQEFRREDILLIRPEIWQSRRENDFYSTADCLGAEIKTRGVRVLL